MWPPPPSSTVKGTPAERGKLFHAEERKNELWVMHKSFHFQQWDFPWVRIQENPGSLLPLFYSAHPRFNSGLTYFMLGGCVLIPAHPLFWGSSENRLSLIKICFKTHVVIFTEKHQRGQCILFSVVFTPRPPQWPQCMSPRRNWDPPPPLLCKRVCPSPRNQRGGGRLACGWGGGGVPIPTTNEKA